jgi:hypothetical protein
MITEWIFNTSLRQFLYFKAMGPDHPAQSNKEEKNATVK